jgi:hypothetical protein
VTLEVVFLSYLSVWRLLLALGHYLSHVLWERFVAAAAVAAAGSHFAACWRIMPSSPDFAILLVNPDCFDLVALAPVKVALLVEVVGFAMHFVAVAKPVVVVERPAAVAMPAVVAVLVVAVARPVAVVQAMELFELHSD